MPRLPTSPQWCLICGVDAGAATLYPVHLARPFTRRDGKRTTRSIPTRICLPCVTSVFEANARFRSRAPVDLLERSRPVRRVRTAQSTYASREAMADASLAAAARATAP